MAVMANFALVSGGQANAHGPVKFDVITFTGPTYNYVAVPSAETPTGNTGLKTGLQSLTEDGRAPIAVLPAGGNGAHVLQYEPSTDRLKIVVAATNTEVANGVDLSGTTFRVMCVSK